MNIILFEPEIPQNTGNIIRTCNATECKLTLVKPLGFSTSNRMLKRAGLDYIKDVTIEEIDDLKDFLEHTDKPFYFFSSKAQKSFTEVDYPLNSMLIFGSETKGLPDFYFEDWPDRMLTIPMKPNARCLNLSNAVAIAIYEARKKQGFFKNCTAYLKSL